MAVVLGTSAGFVTIRPSADPAGSTITQDNNAYGGKFVSPAGVNSISEIGWYCDNATEEANYQVGIYSHDAVNNRPLDLLATSGDIAKGTTAGWKYAPVSYSLIAETTYWLVVQLDDTVSSTSNNYTTDAGQKYDFRTGRTTLPIPWGTSTGTAGALLGIYALYTTVTTPIIFSINDYTLLNNQNNVIINGSYFSPWSNSVKLNSQSNGSGVIANQTITAENSGQITITTNHGLIGLGSAYAIVYSSGLIQSEGFPVFLTSEFTTPAKTVLVGGAGTKVNNSDNNAGFFSSGQTNLTAQDTNGGPIYNISGCGYEPSSGIIYKTESFTNGLAGNWCRVSNGSNEFLNNRYHILQSNPDWLMIGTGYTESSNLNVTIGGALKTFEKAFSSGIITNGDTLQSTYGNGSYVTEDSETITLQFSGIGGSRPSIGGGLINYV